MEFETTPDGTPFAFHDMPTEKFPFMVRYLRESPEYGLGGGPMVSWCLVDGPMIMKVPGFGDQFPISVQFQFADGEAVLTTSDGESYFATMPPEMIQGIHTIAKAVADGQIKNGQMPPLEER